MPAILGRAPAAAAAAAAKGLAVSAPPALLPAWLLRSLLVLLVDSRLSTVVGSALQLLQLLAQVSFREGLPALMRSASAYRSRKVDRTCRWQYAYADTTTGVDSV
jgi:hypothetical protein